MHTCARKQVKYSIKSNSIAVWRFISPIIWCDTSCIIKRWLFMVSTFAINVVFSCDYCGSFLSFTLSSSSSFSLSLVPLSELLLLLESRLFLIFWSLYSPSISSSIFAFFHSLHLPLSSLLSFPFHFPALIPHWMLKRSAAFGGESYIKSLSRKSRFSSQLRKLSIIGIAAAPTASIANRVSGVLQTSFVGSTSTTWYDGGYSLVGILSQGWQLPAFSDCQQVMPIPAKWFPSTGSVWSLLSCN